MTNSTKTLQKKRKTGISDLFSDYSNYHRTVGNQVTHWIGIPMIVISLLGLLSHVGSGHLNAGVAFWAFSAIWYVLLDWRIGAPFNLVTLGAYLIGTVIPPLWLGILFIVGWVFQLVGHSYFEKKRPALVTNIRHIWVGPLWLYSKLIQYP